VHQELKELRGRQVHKEQQGPKVPLVVQEPKEREVLKVHKV
jgi:hypothetical protein